MLDNSEHADRLQRVVSEGRSVGIDLVVTADRLQALPPLVQSAVGGRIVLRMPNMDDFTQLGLPRIEGMADLPVGRAFLTTGNELQLAVLTDDPDHVDGPDQAQAMERLGAELRERATDRRPSQGASA